MSVRLAHIRSRTTLIAVLLTGALPVSACGSATDAGREHPESGTVSLPLTTTTGSSVYRLSSVSLYVFGTSTTNALATSEDPDETSLSVTLSTGSYSANLYSWTLQKQQDDGQFVTVPAVLLSSAYQTFGISNGSTTTLVYRFQSDGVIVVVGAGELRVKIAVDEVAPVCTPFGTGCSEGTWCAPTGLTGAPLTCIAAGMVGIGDPCSAPADCVASSSCIDLGEGPVCTELCPRESFDEPCASGGTCQRAAADYGVCR
jgi:hypothetical protein